MSSSTPDGVCHRCAHGPYEHERQPLFATIPALAKMSKQILDDSIGLICDPFNWKVRLYGTQPRTPPDEHSVYRRGVPHKVHQSDAAPPSKSSPVPRSTPSSRIPQPHPMPPHESKREKKTVHFLEPDYKKKPASGASHSRLPAEPSKLELYEVISPANDVPRIIDIDYDTKTHRWCIDESATFPDREDPVATICSRSVLRAMQFADSFPGYSALASPTRMPQFQVNRLPSYGIVKNPEGDLATLKASSHDLYHIGNLETFLLHTYGDPEHVFSLNGGQYMKHWLIDLPQLVTVLSNSKTRQKCKSAFLYLVRHGFVEKVTLQLWGSSDSQPGVSSNIETVDWATWVRLYRNKISKTLRHDLDRALGFLHTENVAGSSWPTAVHRKLSIMSHKGLTSTVSSVEMCDAMESTMIEPWSSSSANAISFQDVKSNTGPSNAATFSERLSPHNEDGPVRPQTPYTTSLQSPQSRRPLPLPPGPNLRPRPASSVLPSRLLDPASESQDLAKTTDLDTTNDEDSSRTHVQALAEVDYGTETGGLVDLNGSSGASANEKPSLTKSRKRALELRNLSMNLLKIGSSKSNRTKNNANCHPAFSNQLDEALTAKQRIIHSSTATQQDLDKAQQEWSRDQEILRIADLLKRDLKTALEQEWGASRQPDMDTCLAQLHDLCDEVSEILKMSIKIDGAVKEERFSPESMLDIVDDESREREGTKQELAQSKDCHMDQYQCPRDLAHHERPQIESEGADEWTDIGGVQTTTNQDPGMMLASLEQLKRMSWTPDDDKANFRLSTLQQNDDDPNRARAECRNPSPTTDLSPDRSDVRATVDHSLDLTTPYGFDVSVLSSDLNSTDNKETVECTNGGSGDGSVSMFSDVFNTVSSQVDHEVNPSIRSASNHSFKNTDEDPFNVVTETSADGAARRSQDISHDDLVAGSDETYVENAAASSQNTQNDFTTPEEANLDKFVDATRRENLNDAVLLSSEQSPTGMAVEEDVENEALLVSPTNLTSYILRSPSSSGKKKKGTARKKWTRVQWAE